MKEASEAADERTRIARSCYAFSKFTDPPKAWHARWHKRTRTELSVSGTRQPDVAEEAPHELPYRKIEADADILVVPPNNELGTDAIVIFSGMEATMGPKGLHSKRLHPKSLFVKAHPNLTLGYNGGMKKLAPEIGYKSINAQRVTPTNYVHYLPWKTLLL